MWVRIPPSVQKVIMMIAQIVIKVKSNIGVEVTYIEKSDSFYNKEVRKLQHKCRIKEVIYGGVFNYYDDMMDFTNSINAGGIIIIDNR